MKESTKARVMHVAVALALLVMAGCSPKGGQQPETVDIPGKDTAIAEVAEQAHRCSNDPRVREEEALLPCGGLPTRSVPRAYRVVGGGGDPVDQVVCDIDDSFVLDGRLFGVEFSGGADGTYRFVRTPDIQGLRWNASGRYHMAFPEGRDKAGTMTTEGGGTTTAANQARSTTGGERFTLTPTEDCT